MQKFTDNTTKKSKSKRLLSLCLALLIMCWVCGCTETDAGEVNSEDSRRLAESILEMPSTSFNLELAKICAELSEVSEQVSDSDIRRCYSKYGISNFDSANYGTSILGGGAYCLGTKAIEKDGQTYILIVITARGSTTKAEFLGDQRLFEEFSSGRKREFGNYRVWDNVKEFEDKIWDGFSNYMTSLGRSGSVPKGSKLKILVTGHSLGGAAASLLGARIKDELLSNASVSGKMTKEDVYVYTFNAIKVLTSPENVEKGYENIHNVYNKYDSFGPEGNQKNWNASSPKAKFGHTEMYEKQENEEGSSANSHMNFRYALDHPEECKLKTCTGIKSGSSSGTSSTGTEPAPEAAPAAEETYEDTGSDEYTQTETYEESDYSDSGITIPPGEYLSTDGFNQVFTFYGTNSVTMSAFGIEADGTYTIKNGRIYISYNLFGEYVWDPPFSMNGDTLNIAGTDFVRSGY